LARPCFPSRPISNTDAFPLAAAVVTFIALLSSLSFHVTFASLLSFIAGLVTLTAFAFDIALFINVRDKARQARQGLPDPTIRDIVALGPGTATMTSPFLLLSVQLICG
jgi:hypothetical protein